METTNTGLIGYLSIIEDPRINRKKLHLLIDVLFMSVVACICGCDTWADIYEFGLAREEWLHKFIDLKNGIPSPDTIARVFSLIDPSQFEQAFRIWVASIYEKSTDGEIIAIDGKRVRGSYGNGKSAIHVVGAYATESGLALGQVKTSDKSNEITAIPELLNNFLLKGSIITMDAMGCQKEIVKKIKEISGDYVISLKGNQSNLHKDVKLFLDSIKDNKLKKKHDYFETIEKGHGRVETRRAWISDDIDWLDNKDKWSGLNAVGCVEAEVYRKEKNSVETRYFICSIKPDAEKFSKAVRQHWAIENNLHWQLDVTFTEDKLRARIKNAAHNLSIMRRMVLNTLKKEDSGRKISLKTKRKKANWSEAFLLKLLTIFSKF